LWLDLDEDGGAGSYGELLPDTTLPYQQLVTDKDGNKTWVNMTHYSDLVKVEILPQQDVTVEKQPTLACYWMPNIKTGFDLIENSIYTIKFNGTEYQCTPYKVGTFYYIGNASLWSSSETNTITGNNEPFVFRVVGDSISFIVAEAGTYNVAIEGFSEVCQKISGDYTGIYNNELGAIALNQSNVDSGGENSFSVHGLALGEHSFSHGSASVAMGKNSFATVASSALSENQFTTGKNNVPDMTNTYAHIVGNGSTTRSNAHTLDWEGNAWYQGNVYVGSTSGTNKDAGSKKLATEEYVDNLVDHTSPEYFGAVGDGVTDDSEAITQALTASKNVVFDGDKTYAVGSTIVIPADSMVNFRGATIVPLGNHDVIQVKPGSFTENLVVRCTNTAGWDSSAIVLYGRDQFHHNNPTTIRNIKLFCNTSYTAGLTTQGVGVKLYGDNFGDNVAGITADEIFTYGFGIGILFEGVDDYAENPTGGLVFIGANKFRGYWSFMDNVGISMKSKFPNTHITNNIFTDLQIEPLNTIDKNRQSSYGIYC
jgi:hypothetical protein